MIRIILISLLVSGCSLLESSKPFDPKATTNIEVNKIQYPSLPDINVTPLTTMRSVQWDVARTDEKIKKNISSCENDNSPNCFENKPIENSNIHRGLNLENFNNLIFNIENLREYIIYLNSLVNEVNLQRKEWRDKK